MAAALNGFGLGASNRRSPFLATHRRVRHTFRKATAVVLVPGTPDIFAWRLTADKQYSASSTYGAMFVGCSTPLGARQLWKTSAPQRVKFFFWLAMHGRCWTAHRRWRHGLQDDALLCIFCNQQEETIDHIILGCVFSREVWARCLQIYRLDSTSFMQWWIQSRKSLSKPIQRAFDSLFFLIGWRIWKERNSRTFDGVQKTAAQLVQAPRGDLG